MTGQPGRSGPRHKPSAIKKLEGNRGKRKLREEPLAHGWPQVPLHLSSDERLIWSRLMKTMPAGVVAACDEYLIEAFCVAVSTYREADAKIKQTSLMVRGSESPIANPLLRIRSRAFNEMRAGAIELGLTPAARARLVKVDVEPADPLEMLLGMDPNYTQWGSSKQ